MQKVLTVSVCLCELPATIAAGEQGIHGVAGIKARHSCLGDSGPRFLVRFIFPFLFLNTYTVSRSVRPWHMLAHLFYFAMHGTIIIIYCFEPHLCFIWLCQIVAKTVY